MPIFSNAIRDRYAEAAVRTGVTEAGEQSPSLRSADLEKEVHRWAQRFVNHCLKDGSAELKPNLQEKGPLYIAEFWLRYVQLNILTVLHTANPADIPTDAEVTARNSHAGRLELGSWYEKKDKFKSDPALKALPKEFSELCGIQKVAVPIWDLTTARRWFSNATPQENETSWELYQRFDPDGTRAMNQGPFYSLMPRAWRELPQYQQINATYEDCKQAEAWFKGTKPIDNETSWELYQRFDPDGTRAMHQAHFYSLMPRGWRELPQYQVVNATYEDCKQAEAWFKGTKPIDNETSWELYQRFDPDRTRAMNQGHFYSLMPRAWRELPQYQVINATYEDCKQAEAWFKGTKPIDNETSWELYQRYDPNGTRAMNQGHFYSLMPRAWRELPQYQYINATYEDCKQAEAWFKGTKPIDNETSWELYQRYDPNGTRAMNQAQFYSLMPRAWRELPQYQVINATYEDCKQAEAWFKGTKPIDNETSWELYQRYDPNGTLAMNQGHFYSLMPRAWRELPQYQLISATYADCKQAEAWFKGTKPIDNETSWELYQRYDPDGTRAMNQAQFYSLMPRAWRELPQYQVINATYEDCKQAEAWFKGIKPIDNETSWELYQRFDPDGTRAMNQGHFYSLMPRAWRELPQYQQIKATYDVCKTVEATYGTVSPGNVRDFLGASDSRG